MKNKVVLIGMPGCGKTTIGKIICKKSSFKFYDMDEYIEKKAGKTISEIFLSGEEVFRNIESEVCKELSLKENILISTGGGVIKRKENIDELKREGLIIFIDRPVDKILEDVDIKNRPLLKDDKKRLLNLYNERIELYRKYADVIIKNDKSKHECVDAVIKNINKM